MSETPDPDPDPGEAELAELTARAEQERREAEWRKTATPDQLFRAQVASSTRCTRFVARGDDGQIPLDMGL